MLQKYAITYNEYNDGHNITVLSAQCSNIILMETVLSKIFI